MSREHDNKIVDFREMVVGFMFDLEQKHVVLIRKTKPAWQQGFLNGVGGKVEPGEDAYAAMKREFSEETGVEVDGWQERGTMTGPGWSVTVFAAFSHLATAVQTTTEEQVEVVELESLSIRNDLISNVGWLIQMILDHGTRSSDGGPRYFSIQY